MSKNIIIALIVIITIVLLLFLYKTYSSNCDIDGAWSGESTFLKKAGLSELLLVFKDGELAITALDEEGKMMDNSITSYMISKSWINAITCKSIYDLETENDTLFPKNLSMTLNEKAGLMVLYDEDKTYATLIKNNELSLLL